MTGAELAAIRKAAGLSQGALARRVGIGRHAVMYWETRPVVDRRAWAVQRIAAVLTLPDEPDLTFRACENSALERALAAALAALREREAQRLATRRVRCGAKTRKGTPCRMKSEPGKRRCKFHGGMSTGARTPEGKARIAEAQRRRWARYRQAKAEDTELNRLADARTWQADAPVRLDDL